MIDQEDVNRWTVDPNKLKQDYDELKEQHETFTKLIAEKFMQMNRGMIKLQAERDQALEKLEYQKDCNAQKVDQLQKELSDSTNHYNGIINELHEEVKRLTSALCNSNAQQLDQALHERDEARAEVGRLKAQILEDQEKCNPYVSLARQKDVDQQRAEVERLTMEFAAANSEIERMTKQNNDMRAEVAQLRAERDLAQQLGRDEASAELERLKTELAQAISERTPHDYGILRDQRDDYRERLGAACKEVSDLEAKVKLLTKERDKERANFEVLRKDSNKWHMQERDDYWEEVFRMRSQIDGWRTRCEIAEQNCKPFLQVRPDPSRLEIAAMFVAHAIGSIEMSFKEALEAADALIAASREVAK